MHVDDPLCPVKSLKLYMSKFNPCCEFFFQKPKDGDAADSDDVWYQNRVLGVHKIDNKMKEWSKAAGLSRIFSNRCFRAMATTVLSEAGVESHNIMGVTGHRNEGSVKSYVS